MCKKINKVLAVFEHLLQISWDDAIDYIDSITVSELDVKLLVYMYRKAYTVDDYIETGDPDNGLCFSIRKFVIDELYKLIEQGKLGG